jgi:hypothetical protein
MPVRLTQVQLYGISSNATYYIAAIKRETSRNRQLPKECINYTGARYYPIKKHLQSVSALEPDKLLTTTPTLFCGVSHVPEATPVQPAVLITIIGETVLKDRIVQLLKAIV